MGRRFLLSTALADLAALTAGIVIASAVVPEFGTLLPWRAQPDVWPLLAVMYGSAVAGSYVSARSWHKHAPRPSYGRAVSIVAIGMAITTFAVVFSRMYWSRPFLLVAWASWLTLALAHRAARRRRPWTESIVAITREKALAEDLRAAPHVDLVDVMAPGDNPPSRPYPEGTVLAVDLRTVLGDYMAQWVSSCHLAGAPVRSFTGVYEEHTGRLPIVHLVEGWELTAPLESRGLYGAVKRLADTLLIVATAIISVPLALVIGLAVKLDSRGPVIFRQERIGRGGRPFVLYKFRTMVVDAEREGARFASPWDERLTGVGRWLRRFRVDELPQLWNVLRGDLSLVGPRPEQKPFVDEFTERIPFYTHRHLVRPGVTGWAQVNFGYADDEVDTLEKLSYDLYYIKHVSPWLDLSILGRSIWTILSGFGAQ